MHHIHSLHHIPAAVISPEASSNPTTIPLQSDVYHRSAPIRTFATNGQKQRNIAEHGNNSAARGRWMRFICCPTLWQQQKAREKVLNERGT
jgi:hypothetical protein